jgi:FkbM family methyltransferase
MGMPPPRMRSSPLVRAVQAHLPAFAPAVVFDVGANVGQSTAIFVEAFPSAAVYAFEPVLATFESLRGNVAAYPQVSIFNLALGRRSGAAHMESRRNSVISRVIERPGFFSRTKSESVSMTSGDAFCAKHHVERIDLLKVDAEGHDLEVLIGFQDMLAGMRIGLLEVEVGMNRANTRHVPFEAVKAFLEPRDYHLFHFNEQVMDIPFSGRPILRRSNAAFISEALAEANRRQE